MDRYNDVGLIEQFIAMLNPGENNECADSAEFSAALSIKSFIDILPGGFFIYRADENEEIIYANRALLRMFRCDTLSEFKEYTGNSFKGIVYREDLDEVERLIKEQIENNGDDLDYVEYRILRKDGVLRWVEDYGHFIRTQQSGNFFYVFVTDSTEKINRRISERAMLINESQQKENQIKSLIEEYDKERKLIRQEHLQRLEVIEGLSVNYESILYVDLENDKVFPYRFSGRIEKQFDKKMQTRPYRRFIKDYAAMWVHPEERENFSKTISPSSIRKKLAQSSTFYFNFRCVQGGETKFLQLRIVNVGEGERISQVVIGIRSIDEEILQEMKQKKLLEDALNNAKLAYVAKNSFQSNMSHDMRTPLNAIFGYTALAKKNLGDTKAVEGYLTKIETASKQMLDLVEMVLKISYLESRDFALEETEYNLRDMVNEVCDSVASQAEQKKISVTCDLSALDHEDVFVDGDKLKQIIQHIADNAVKYTKNGGKVNITITERSTSKDFSVFEFVITDNGIGISEEALPRIFNAFEREKNTTFSGVYGTGLGLTIAKHIAEIMGGNIEVESKSGKGSKFTVKISLRVMQKHLSKTDENEDPTNSFEGKKILLVEDNEINLEIETEILQDFGLIVDCAENGKIAVDKMKAAKPDEYLFVLMDIQMPVMDGREATREIRKLGGYAEKIPIIALSANAFESDKRASIECGMDDHLNKPVDVPVLLQAVSKVLKTKIK